MISPGWHTTIFPSAPDIIYGCSYIAIPLLLVMHWVKAKPRFVEMPVLVTAVNTTLLIASLIYLVSLPVEFFIAYYSGAEYEQYAFTNWAFGSYWWAFWTLMLVNLLLPQLFWIGRLRRSVYAGLAIIAPQILLKLFNYWLIFSVASQREYSDGSVGIAFNSAISWHWYVNLLIHILIYLVILGVVYWLTLRRWRKNHRA